MGRIFLCFLFAIASIQISAQSADLNTILIELDGIVKEKGTDLIQDSWATCRPAMGTLEAEQKDAIAVLLDRMKTARLSLNPYYGLFFQAFPKSLGGSLPEKTHDQWIATLSQMLEEGQSNRANKTKAFLEFSNEYFVDGTLRSSKGGTNWKIGSFHEAIGFKNDQPYLEFGTTDLTAFVKKDTMQINQTSGSYLPLRNMWLGKDGYALWDEGYLGPISAYFSTYSVDTKKGIYDVDSATLDFKKFFDGQKIVGSFQDKLSSEGNSAHPKFISKGRNLVINDLGPNLSLRGGLELRGNRLFSTGNKQNPAAMLMRSESGAVKFKLGAPSFAVKETSEISGKSMTATLYLGQDSIYHPSVNVRYNVEDNVLLLFRGESPIEAIPFFDSYHNFNIQVDEIKWYVSQDSLIYGEEKQGITSDIKSIYFESPDYYSAREFSRIQSIASVNPIVILKILSEQSDTTIHDALTVAKKINPRYSLGSVQTLLYDLVRSGFINYDKENELIEVRDKVFHYANASRNRIDYDRLKITSKTSHNNAVVNSANNEMIVSNVKGVELSPMHRVAMVPDNKELRILKNRSMAIDGQMFAGQTSFEGKGYLFDYEKYSVGIDSIRYLDFFIPSEDGSPQPMGIASRLENGSGTVLIDAPENKSAHEHIPLFPSFSSERQFSIFYDRAQDSSYDRSSFFFMLDPFGFNTLDSFSRNDVAFKGEFYSQNVFEPFKEIVDIQKDYSLGFISSTDASGKKLYQNKGLFKGDVILNNNGLQGTGEVQFLSTTFNSSDITFLPNELIGTSNQFNVAESTTPANFPKVVSDDVTISWIPYGDSLKVKNNSDPFQLFNNNEATLDGELVVGVNGMSGRGDLKFDQGRLESDLYTFSTKSVLVDTANLFVKAVAGDELAFDTKNVGGEIDFISQKARFKANSSDISTNMPYNQYKTSMNEFVWDIPGKIISFTAASRADAFFLSTDPKQDSLIFKGKNAKYDIANSTLLIDGVDEIEVGDAIIEVGNKRVEVEPGGETKKLSKSTIYVDKKQKQHVINDAEVTILSKHNYSATGNYAYDIGSKNQSVVLNNIVCQLDGKGKKSDQQSITRATGEIAEGDQFYIDSKTKFSGTMSLKGDSKELLFRGFAQLDAPLLPQNSWFSINSTGDKKDLFINYDVPKNKDGAPIKTGIFLSKETALAYPSVMNPLSFRKDRPIISTKGQFKYDDNQKSFVFGDSLKIRGLAKKGSVLTYNNETAEVLAEGVMNLCPNIRNVIPMKTVGRISTKYKTKRADQNWRDIPDPGVTAHVMSSIDLPIPKGMMDQMAVDFRSSTFDAQKPVYANDDFYNYALTEFTNKTSQYVDAMKYIGENVIHIPKAADKSSFILGKMEMKWDPDYQALVSKPGKVALVSVDGSPINIMIDVHVEYKMTTNNDDRLYIYLKSPSGLYYFFGYQGGVLNITSDNTRFMSPLNDMKDKERIVEITKELSFEMQSVSQGTANKFLQRAKAAW